jgi:MYXO-CTERM domain-containing protein
MFNSLHFSAQGMFRTGAGLALMVLGSAALAQSAASGKVLYVDKGCSTSGCHEADPSGNANNIRNGANNPNAILAECVSEPQMIPFCGAKGFLKISNVEAADIAAYIANPNFVGPLAVLSTQALTFRRSIGGNASKAQNITVTNQGDANLVLTTVALAGNNAADYKLVAPAAGATQCANGLTIAAKASCSVGVTFDPSVVGARTAELQVTPDPASGLAKLAVGVNGTATQAAEPFAIADAASVNFGNQLLNTASGTKTVVVTNDGEANLTFDSAAFAFSGTNAAEYTVDTAGTCAAASTLAVGATCTVLLKFTPTATGSRTATLTVNSNSTDLVVALSGAGINADDNDGGGGCSIVDPSKNSAVDPTLLALGALALAVLGLRRRRNPR